MRHSIVCQLSLLVMNDRAGTVLIWKGSFGRPFFFFGSPFRTKSLRAKWQAEAANSR